MAKLTEIAAHAGVSEATVSRVLNDKGNVSETTRASVLTSVDVLGYDRPAKLRRRTVGMIGIVVPELTNPVFPVMAQALQSRFAANGYASVICTQAPGGTQEEDYVELLQERGVAGLVFVSGRHADLSADTAMYQELVDRGLPLVTINGPRDELLVPSIATNEQAAVRMALGHLRQLGHERIGLATGQSRYVPSRSKLAAFRDQITEAGLTSYVEQTWFSLEGGELAGRRLVDRGVTAVICGSDLMALGVVRGAEQAGLVVPTDLSVIGYDGSFLAQYASPALTTVRQNIEGITEATVNALTEQITSHRTPPGELLFDPELVVRASTGPAATGS
ncbi:LacI family DNA-binding transcriptional regulator [Calidifontibacter terrae]